VSQRGWIVPSLAVLALVLAGFGLYQSNQGAGALDKRVATLESGAGSAATVTSDLAALKTQVADLSAKLADAPSKLSALDTRLASLEQATPATPTDLSGVTADISALKSDLAALKSQIGDVAPDKLAALKTQLDQLTASIPAPTDTSQLATTLAALDGQVQALQTQLAQVTTVAAPTAPATDPSPQLTTLQSDVDGLKTKLAALDTAPASTELGDIKAQVDKLNTQVAELPARSDLTALQARLDELANRPAPSAPPAADLGPLQADIGDLKTRVAAIETSGKTDTDTVASLRSELDGLTSRVGSLESAGPNPAVAALQASLGDIKQEITALATGSDLKVLQAAVADLQSQPKPSLTGLQPKRLEQIYFDRGSYKLSDAELAKLSTLAGQLKDKPREVAIMGFSDTQGPAEFNRALSLKRASAVRKALLGYDIGTSLITSISGLGEDGPPVETKDNLPEQQNRTVVIYANE
jgi:outer membrane protein OmpA-like peptidoglycan-associated protein/uncharacterized coiled-coil protein SlyX